MKEYDIVFILLPDSEIVNQQVGELKKMVKSEKGEIIQEDNWGIKRLAYSIKKQNEGNYYILNCKLNPAVISELKREFHLNQSIIRFMFIKKG